MRYLNNITLIVFLLISIKVHAQSDQPDLPEVDLKDLSGKTINTSALLDGESPVILNFWATWCSPCIKELSAISEYLEDWQDETHVRVIAISIDDARSSMRVAPFVNGRGWEFEVYLDPNGDFKRAMNVVNPPHTFVINAKGKIIYQHTSYAEGDEEELFDQVKQAL
jgi:cytochrome c biogenesis protein CcmG/thiol:disulfide interchange protein DsbE